MLSTKNQRTVALNVHSQSPEGHEFLFIQFPFLWGWGAKFQARALCFSLAPPQPRASSRALGTF